MNINFIRKIKIDLLIKVLLGLIFIVGAIFILMYYNEHDRKLKQQKKEEEKIKAENTLLNSLSNVKYFNNNEDLSNIGIKTITLKCKYVDRKMFYSIDAIFINKNDKRFPIHSRNYRDNITINFRDIDGFGTAMQEISVSELVNTVDHDGKYIGFSYEGQVEMNQDKYIRIVSWNLTWRF